MTAMNATKTPGALRLADYKYDHGLTHAGLATLVQDSRPDLGACKGRTVQDLIRGERKPSLSMAVKIQELTEILPADWHPDGAGVPCAVCSRQIESRQDGLLEPHWRLACGERVYCLGGAPT